jgi:hypothetical protein
MTLAWIEGSVTTLRSKSEKKDRKAKKRKTEEESKREFLLLQRASFGD